MYLIYLLIALILIGAVFFKAFENSWKYDILSFLGAMCGVVSAGVLALFLVYVPLQRMTVYAGIQKHEELRKMDNLRFKLSEYELVEWRSKIADSNTNLAEAKYYARNPWVSVSIPKAVLSVEPIR